MFENFIVYTPSQDQVVALATYYSEQRVLFILTCGEWPKEEHTLKYREELSPHQVASELRLRLGNWLHVLHEIRQGGLSGPPGEWI